MNVSPILMETGTSHYSERKFEKLDLKTEEGREFFLRKAAMYKYAVQNEAIETYKDFLQKEWYSLQRKLSDFIYDEDMNAQYNMDENDSEGWLMWRTLTDKFAVCTYLLKK